MKILTIIFAFLAALGVIGWVKNIIKIFEMFGDQLTTEIVLRIIGVPVFFVGAVLGYF